jgi:hypothetical protein
MARLKGGMLDRLRSLSRLARPMAADPAAAAAAGLARAGVAAAPPPPPKDSWLGEAGSSLRDE